MAVQVRMFAALREAAGTDQTTCEPGTVSEILERLSVRYGEPFTSRLALAAVLVDGSSVAKSSQAAVAEGSEVALLPPVSGGAA